MVFSLMSGGPAIDARNRSATIGHTRILHKDDRKVRRVNGQNRAIEEKIGN
jgi:hypothetical protein